MLLETLRADGLLSFAPGSPEIPLRSLNVIIGPNGSGKSNLIEAIGLLHAIPTGLASAIRDGGGVLEWPWKGNGGAPATLEARLRGPGARPLRYGLRFAASGVRTEVVDEFLEDADKASSDAADVDFYYRFAGGHPILRSIRGNLVEDLTLRPGTWATDESILSQRRDPDRYPELSWCAAQFAAVQIFREWSFGRYTPLRQPQPTDLPTDVLLPDAQNLDSFSINSSTATKNLSSGCTRMRCRWWPSCWCRRARAPSSS